MAIDHLPHDGFNRFIDTFAGPFGFFTANSPFFFLSGMVCGAIYERVRQVRGHRAAVHKALKRARDLYLVNVMLFLILAAAGYRSEIWRESAKFFYSHPVRGFFLSLIFRYNFRFLDILPLYCMFLAITPFAIAAFQRRKAWLVLVSSVALWGAGQFGIRPGIDFGLNPFAFQLPFFVGLYFGCRYQLDSTPLDGIRNSRFLVALCAFLSGSLFIARVIFGNSHYLHAFFLKNPIWFAQENQGPFRLLNFAAFAFLVWHISPRIPPKLFENPAVRWLALMGQHSPYVFAGSVLLADGFLMFMPAQPHEVSRVFETLITVCLLAVPAWMHREYVRLQASGHDHVSTKLMNDIAWALFLDPVDDAHPSERAKGLLEVALLTEVLDPRRTPDTSMEKESLAVAAKIVAKGKATWKKDLDPESIRQQLQKLAL